MEDAGQPGLAHYLDADGDGVFRPHNIQILTLNSGAIAAQSTFRDTSLFPKFGLPALVE